MNTIKINSETGEIIDDSSEDVVFKPVIEIKIFTEPMQFGVYKDISEELKQDMFRYLFNKHLSDNSNF